MGMGALVRSPGPSRVLGGGEGTPPSPPLPHFQCCLDLCLGRGSEGALAPALRRLRAMRLIPDLVYFCKTSTSSSPRPASAKAFNGRGVKAQNYLPLSSPLQL
eukprot:bmy_11290T0